MDLNGQRGAIEGSVVVIDFMGYHCQYNTVEYIHFPSPHWTIELDMTVVGWWDGMHQVNSRIT